MTNNLSAHSYLNQIKSYEPGKSKSNNKKTIKLSSNENALGSSKKALKAYKKHSNEIFRYADGSCSLLREELSKKHNINANQIVCGAGSDEIISLLISAFAGFEDEIIHSKHGFLMYSISAKAVGATPISVAEKNLKADIESILYAISPKTKMIFIANPNNPTGSYLTKKEIEKLIDNTPKSIMIVLDHAYDEFAQDEPNYPDAFSFVKKHENVVVTRTFSKIHGLASLRLGWCFANKVVADALNKIRGPFNVSGAAQAAGIASLKDEAFIKKSVAHNKKWLTILQNEIEKMQKISSHPSSGNFILIDFKNEEDCKRANEFLLESGIVLREMSSYQLPTCLRATIGTNSENKKLISLLKQIDNNL